MKNKEGDVLFRGFDMSNLFIYDRNQFIFVNNYFQVRHAVILFHSSQYAHCVVF